MSKRVIVTLVISLGALVVANIIVLALYLPSRKNATAKVESSNLTAKTAQPSSAPGSPNNTSAAETTMPASALPAVASGDFTLERQGTSASGNLRIKQFRNRKTKVRRITVEDAHRPDASAVLFESKRTAWVIVSPDDQWIAVNERSATDGGGARLYHRSGNSSVHYVVPEDGGTEGHALQDTVWQTYLKATHADSNTARRGVTIDATRWEDDSRKLDISVTYLPRPDNPDVPEPWSCTYDVVSKQVEPTPDQPAVSPDIASASTSDHDGHPPDTDESSGQAQVVDNPVDDNSPDSEAETVEDDEYPGEKFPATRLDELTVSDVNESSLTDITYAINEMFARHGAEFKDKKVTKQFSAFSWYESRPGLTFDDIQSEFSDLEKQNLKVLNRCRDSKCATARRKSSPVRGQRVQEESTSEKILRGIEIWQDLGGPMPPHP